jgi:hypothetical protein
MPRELPAYYLVGDRPVMMVPTPEGGLDVLAYQWKSGDFQREMSYLSRVTGTDVEVDVVTEDEFQERVARLREKLKQERE